MQKMLFRYLWYQVIFYAIQQIQGQVKQVMKVIESGDNEPLSLYTKFFQITIRLFCAHHFKKLIKNNHVI